MSLCPLSFSYNRCTPPPPRSYAYTYLRAYTVTQNIVRYFQQIVCIFKNRPCLPPMNLLHRWSRFHVATTTTSMLLLLLDYRYAHTHAHKERYTERCVIVLKNFKQRPAYSPLTDIYPHMCAHTQANTSHTPLVETLLHAHTQTQTLIHKNCSL